MKEAHAKNVFFSFFLILKYKIIKGCDAVNRVTPLLTSDFEFEP